MAVYQRVKSVTGTSVTNLTATFDEPGALGTGYLLFAVVTTTDSSVTISNSWGVSALAGGGNNGSTAVLQGYAKQSDGSTNGINVTVSAGVSVLKIDLYAFSGYASTTPQATIGASGASGTSIAIGPTTTSTTQPNTVAIAAVSLGSGSSGGFTSFGSAFTGPATSTGTRAASAAAAFTTTGQTPSTTFTWVTARISRTAMWVMQGVAAADSTPPAVTITYPVANAIVSGTVTITATATDDVAVTGVTAYYQDGPIGALTNTSGSTWSLAADTTTLNDGTYVLSVAASDAAGNVTTANVTVSVKNAVTVPATPPPSSLVLGGTSGATKLYFGGTSVPRIYQGPSLLFGSAPNPGSGSGGSTPGGGGAVTPTAFYGPNGSHWPDQTPRRGDTFDSVVEIAPTQSALNTALTNAQTNFPNGKVKILVQPGVWTGTGAGSSVTGWAQSKGSPTRPYRILVTPRDAWGSVTGAGAGIAFVDVNGVSFVGFDLQNDAVLLRNCRNTAFAWSRVKYMNTTANGVSGIVNVQWVEMVAAEAQLQDTDRAAARTAGAAINGLQMIGCYLAPSYKNNGSAAHCDTFQFSGDSVCDNILFQDTAMFTSSSECVIGGPVNHMDYKKVLIVAGTRGLGRYPMISGGQVFSNPFGINGAAAVATSADSYFLGSISSAHVWTSVTNTVLPGGTTVPATSSGAFTTDASFNSLDGAWLDSNCPKPDSARLASIWAW